jgi:HB1, ASXL, restriction endonuclease HTH domain
MDALEKRVAERMAAEAKELRDLQMALGRRKQATIKSVASQRKHMDKLFEVLADGGKPTKSVLDKGTAALRLMSKAAKDIVCVNEQMAVNAGKLAKLDDPAERERRLKLAHDMGAGEKPLTGVEGAELVLIREGKAMHITDLTKEVLETGIVKLSGKTPEQTMSAYMAKEAAKDDGMFVRLAPAVFDLRERQPAVS